MNHGRTLVTLNSPPATGGPVAQLAQLQQLSCLPVAKNSVVGRQVRKLRAALPDQVLRCFDHLAEHGRIAVSMITNTGACGSCHLRLPSGMASKVHAFPALIHQCPNCGCFLYSENSVLPEKRA